MIPQTKYIIFNVPSTQKDLIRPRYPTPHHKCRFNCGNYNKRLVCDILAYNGIQAASSDRDKKVTMYWGTCLEVSNQQISQYGNSTSGYNNHNFNPILTGPVNNYSGNLENVNILFRYNHFPNSKLFLGNKAEFSYIIQKNPAYDSFPRFLPFTYILPRDRDSLFKAMRSHPSQCYIAKPPSSSCGNGIKLVTYADFYYISPNSVVSEYISRPLCIDGFKFDLRVYVLVTSFCPLRAFVAKEGLARFATESYSSSSSNMYSHLTNATLNKKSRHWENGAFKWKLTELIQEVAYRWSNQSSDSPHNGHDGRENQKNAQAHLMDKILSTIALTLAFVQPSMCPKERKRLLDPCFELFGFDLIFDRNFRPYILEINTMPSLNTDEDVDYEVKAPLLAQAFSIVGIPDMPGDQLHDAVKNFKMPPGGVKEFDEEVVKQEDERNRLTGNGFVRIFPSEKYSSKYTHLLFQPRLSSKLLQKEELAQQEQILQQQKQILKQQQEILLQQEQQLKQENNELQQINEQQPPQHFIAKNISNDDYTTNSSNTITDVDTNKKVKPPSMLEGSINVKTIHMNSNNSSKDIKSKTLPSLAIPSPQNKPGTNNASRIKVSGSTNLSNSITQTNRIRQIGTPGPKNGNEFNNKSTNRARTYHTNRANIQQTDNENHPPIEEDSQNSGSSPHYSSDIGTAVLAFYLNKIDLRLRATSDPRLAARAQCFLVAQGYRAARGVAGVRALLQHYLAQVKTWSSENNKSSGMSNGKSAIPEKMRNELITGDDETFKKILKSCDLPMVKNIRLLFK